jgi:hypothetical protein
MAGLLIGAGAYAADQAVDLSDLAVVGFGEPELLIEPTAASPGGPTATTAASDQAAGDQATGATGDDGPGTDGGSATGGADNGDGALPPSLQVGEPQAKVWPTARPGEAGMATVYGTASHDAGVAYVWIRVQQENDPRLQWWPSEQAFRGKPRRFRVDVDRPGGRLAEFETSVPLPTNAEAGSVIVQVWAFGSDGTKSSGSTRQVVDLTTTTG